MLFRVKLCASLYQRDSRVLFFSTNLHVVICCKGLTCFTFFSACISVYKRKYMFIIYILGVILYTSSMCSLWNVTREKVSRVIYVVQYNVFVRTIMRKSPFGKCGQCSSRSTYASAQSDLRSTLFADNSIGVNMLQNSGQ